MKKLLTIGFVSLGLISTSVFSGTSTWIYETSRHNIKINCLIKGDNTLYSNNCTYQSWNKPKRINQGRPDFQIRKGEFGLGPQGNRIFEFKTGNVKIEMFDELRGNHDYLDVYINEQKKSRYRLYEIDY